jgi:hypothetical protein
LIRHARWPATLAVLSLAVAMIEPAFGTLLMPAIGAAPLLEPRLMAAIQAAIAVSAIAVLTDQEQYLATQAKPLPKHHFAVRRRHRSGRAGLDNGNCFVAP